MNNVILTYYLNFQLLDALSEYTYTENGHDVADAFFTIAGLLVLDRYSVLTNAFEQSF